jgi:hypothetical protein
MEDSQSSVLIGNIAEWVASSLYPFSNTVGSYFFLCRFGFEGPVSSEEDASGVFFVGVE